MIQNPIFLSLSLSISLPQESINPTSSKGLVALGFSRAQKTLCWIIFIKLKSHWGGKGNKLRE
jgi:hypothetical protein